jgi:hypothetical protein
MRVFSVGLLLVAVVFVAGCGGGGGGRTGAGHASGEAAKPPAEVVRDAVKALEGATAVHLSGHVVSGEQEIGIDISIVRGKGAAGTLTVGGAKVDLVLIGETTYIRGSPALWEQYTHSRTAAQLFAGQWLKVPSHNNPLEKLTNLTSDRGLWNELTSGRKGWHNQGATTYRGHSVVAVSDAADGTLYVAASGTPYPVAIAGGGQGTLTFDHWNHPASLTAPKGLSTSRS